MVWGGDEVTLCTDVEDEADVGKERRPRYSLRVLVIIISLGDLSLSNLSTGGGTGTGHRAGIALAFLDAGCAVKAGKWGGESKTLTPTHHPPLPPPGDTHVARRAYVVHRRIS